jgi:YfiH family protein
LEAVPPPAILKSELLSNLKWLDHGFGTRQAPPDQNGMAFVKQIHSNKVLVAAEAGFAGEGDALLTNRPHVIVSVRTADCLPILLADPRHHAVAAIHAGWRGTAARIAETAIANMVKEYGTSPEELIAAIGPGIGPCCYEVGAEVAMLFGLKRAGKVDLAAANRSQLIEAGVPAAAIEVLPLCTRCDAGTFHSYRRDGNRAGRMISYAGIAD